MNIVFLFAGYLIGIFGFAQVVYPLFFALPLAHRLKRGGLLRQPIPKFTIFSPPVVWCVLLGITAALVHWFFEDYLTVYAIGLGAGLLMIVFKMPSQKQSLIEDFMDTWGQYVAQDPSEVYSIDKDNV